MQVWDIMGCMCGESVCMDRCICSNGCGGWRLDMSLVEGGLYLSSKNAGLGLTEQKYDFFLEISISRMYGPSMFVFC